MQKNRSKLITTSLLSMLALAAANSQALSQTTYPKPLTGTTVTITSSGQQRTFILHAPTTPASSPGAVVVYHGGTIGTSAQAQALSLMDNQADLYGFYSVYPQALNGHWTDGRISTQGGADDVQFTKDIVSYLAKTYKVSTSKVFGTGISNGGIMQYQIACTAPGLFRAIAPIAANITDLQRAACVPSKVAPVEMFVGTADQYMPYGGGYPALIEGRVDPSLKTAAQATGVQTDSFVSGPETAAFWAGLNGCTGSTVTNLPDKAADGTTVTKTDYTGCASGAGTSLYTILNGGHTWPGANVTIDIGMGLDTKDISATTEMVTFFKKFGL